MIIDKKDFDHFYKSLCDNGSYSSLNDSIRKIETFLIYWLNGEDFPNAEEYIESIYNIFRKKFHYNGTLYRGIEIDNSKFENQVLKSEYLACFTDELEVAKYFSGKSKEYGYSNRENTKSFICMTKAKNALSLDSFLLAIQEKTDNTDLMNVIEERIWENEKIHQFNLNDIEFLSQ